MSTDTKTVKYEFRPGINRESTEYAAEGGWYDGNRVRFRDGKPQNIRGWQKTNTNSFLGTSRAIHSWAALDGDKLLSLATEHRAYIYQGGSFNNITPMVSTVSVSSCFNVSSGDTTVTVTVTAHGMDTNTFVNFTNSTEIGGSITLTGDYQVTKVNNNVFQVQSTVAADATSLTAGNSTMNIRFPSGTSTAVGGFGYGAGEYGGLRDGVGVRAWNEAADSSNITLEIRQWSLTNFGENLLLNPTPEGRIFKWIENNGVGTDAVVVTAAPTISNGVIVSPIDRHVLSLGCTDLTGTMDPLLVRWCSREDFDDWTPSIANTAGEVRLAGGPRIVGAINAGNLILVWTDKTLQGFEFVGSPLVFGTRQLGDNCGLIGRHAAAQMDGRAFWMGEANFYVFAGQVQVLPCTVRKYVFGDFNFDQKEKVFCGINTEFEELTWLYPSSESYECNRYVSFSPSQNYWTFGEAIWTSWEPPVVFNNMLTTGASITSPAESTADNYLFDNEPRDVYTADAQQVESFIESGEFDIGDGDDILFIDRIIPDFEVSVGSLELRLKTKKYPNSTEVVKGPFTVNDSSTQIRPRARGRTGKIRISTNTAQTNWKFGTMRLDLMPDGKR